MQNADINNQDREVRELLRDYPAPAPDEGFYERALVRATHEGSKRQRNRWMLAGFGAAIAATIAAWMVGGLLLNDPQLPEADPAIPGVTIALAEPRTVNLVFASASALESATLTVTLPDELVDEIDRWEKNRSKFLLEASLRELSSRRREELERSLDAPHSESAWVAEQGLGEWGSAAEVDDEDLLDPAAACGVRWRDGEGWTEVSE